MRNTLLSKKLKGSETRILIIDDNQIRYNQISDILNAEKHSIHAILFDDLKNFEKQLNLNWDVIIFGQAYDLKYDQTISLVQNSAEFNIPILLLKPENYYKEQYQSYINKGIYDVVDLDFPDRFYISFVRAYTYSRSLQMQKLLHKQLEHLQDQNDDRIQTTHTATATLQEGIHTAANDEYLTIFGLQNNHELLGLPILDVLQPTDITDFKQRFKKISQGQFELGKFQIHSQHPLAQKLNPLKVEFLPSSDEDALQLSIVTTQLNKPTEAVIPNKEIKLKASLTTIKKIQLALQTTPAKLNAFVLFSFAFIPQDLLQQEWQIIKSYFTEAQNYIKSQIQQQVFIVDTLLTGVLVQAESHEMMKSYLVSLASLNKIHMLEIGSKHYPVQFKLGYSMLDISLFVADQVSQQHFDEIIEKTFNQSLSEYSGEDQIEYSQEFDPEFEQKIENKSSQDNSQYNAIEYETSTQAVTLESSLLQSEPQNISEPTTQAPLDRIVELKQQFSTHQLQLKFQQLYDKQDCAHISEVTTECFIDQKWINVHEIPELNQDILFSIQIDRWILIEACKQLHNFIIQYPNASLLLNLNPEILFKDQQLKSILTQLLQNFKHCQHTPLILQFDYAKCINQIDSLQMLISELKHLDLKISLKNVAIDAQFEPILQRLDLDYLLLTPQTAQMLNNEHQQSILQKQIMNYLEIKDVDIVLGKLDDMNVFANAWNIETRFLQGNYFQKPLDHLTDVQDQ